MDFNGQRQNKKKRIKLHLLSFWHVSEFNNDCPYDQFEPKGSAVIDRLTYCDAIRLDARWQHCKLPRSF